MYVEASTHGFSATPSLRTGQRVHASRLSGRGTGRTYRNHPLRLPTATFSTR